MHQAPALAIHLETAAANRACYGQLASGHRAFSPFHSVALICAFSLLELSPKHSSVLKLGASKAPCATWSFHRHDPRAPLDEAASILTTAAFTVLPAPVRASIRRRDWQPLHLEGAHPPVSGCWSHAHGPAPYIAAYLNVPVLCQASLHKHARLLTYGFWLCQMPSASQDQQASSSETAACPFPFKTCSPPPAHHHNCTATRPLATLLALTTTTPSLYFHRPLHLLALLPCTQQSPEACHASTMHHRSSSLSTQQQKEHCQISLLAATRQTAEAHVRV